MILDADQHLFERADMWSTYCDPGKRHLAITIEPDDLGYWWLTNRWEGRRIWYAWVPTPEDGSVSMGGPIERWRQGLPSEVDYRRDLPQDYWDAGQRLAKLDEWGIDRALVLTHWGLVWGRGVQNLDVLRTNLEAWNRRAVEVQQEGRGRLLCAGHVSFRGADPGWAERQLASLAAGGVRSALISYGLADGRRLSHPDHERIWSAFVDHGITPLFHVLDNETRASGFDHAWFENDHDPAVALLDLPFFNVGVQLALADLVYNGVFARHERLRVGVVELGASWLPALMDKLDACYEHGKAVTGRYLLELDRPPSAFLRERVRVAPAFKDDIAALVSGYGDLFMFGGDYPHCEGLKSPLKTYSSFVGDLAPAAAAALYGGTAAELLGV